MFNWQSVEFILTVSHDRFGRLITFSYLSIWVFTSVWSLFEFFPIVEYQTENNEWAQYWEL